MSKSAKMTHMPLEEHIQVLKLTDLPCEMFLEVLKRIRYLSNMRGLCKLFEAHIKRCNPLLEAEYMLNTNKFNMSYHHQVPPHAEIQLHCTLYRVTRLELSGLRHNAQLNSIGQLLGRHAVHLTALDLHRSSIHAEWLNGLTRLTGLTDLNMSENVLMGRTPGAQRDLELPVNLTNLEMRSCELRGFRADWRKRAPDSRDSTSRATDSAGSSPVVCPK